LLNLAAHGSDLRPQLSQLMTDVVKLLPEALDLAVVRPVDEAQPQARAFGYPLQVTLRVDLKLI
jgi:hypothetical protein